jgi:hypothetical protein
MPGNHTREDNEDRESDRFYAELPELTEFLQVVDERHYVPAPADWLVVITDVRGSTRAIEAGRYKDVNALGASTIIAMRNALPKVQIPFVFGGDGATLLVPASEEPTVRGVLVGLRQMAQNAFSLELRCGMVSVRELNEHELDIKVAKFRVSPHISLAMLMGEGVATAESWIKSAEVGHQFEVAQGKAAELDLEGFECRWQPIENRRGTMMSLLVQALPGGEPAERVRRYRAILSEINEILGKDAGHPIDQEKMVMRGLFSDFSVEARAKSGASKGKLFKAMWSLSQSKSLIGKALMLLRREAGGFDGSTYLSEFVRNCDFRKFDETLRMVVDVSSAQVASLHLALKAARQRGEIAYGVHLSARALVTCHVRSYTGDNLHFIDGDAGGYALAAKQMKAQLSERCRPAPDASS